VTSDPARAGALAEWAAIDVATLTRALNLTAAGDHRWQAWAASPQWPIFPGSQLAGSSVVAVERSFPGLEVRSLSLVFSRAGRSDEVETAQVTTLHAGRSSASAEVAWSHSGGVHCTGIALLAVARSGGASFHPAPVRLEPPVDGADDPPVASVAFIPFEVRQPDATGEDVRLGQVRTWLRCHELPPAEDEPTLHRALLAYASEPLPLSPLDRSVRLADPSVGYSVNIVTHSLTVHAPADLRGWHLVVATLAQVGRGVVTSQTRTYSADGRLVLTVDQVALTRPS
jgi:acyl-CoA thioesterase-2